MLAAAQREVLEDGGASCLSPAAPDAVRAAIYMTQRYRTTDAPFQSSDPCPARDGKAKCAAQDGESHSVPIRGIAARQGHATPPQQAGASAAGSSPTP